MNEDATPELADLEDHATASGAMLTLLGRFSDRFSGGVSPVMEPLEAAAETVAERAEAVEVELPLAGLRNLAHEIRRLLNKVEKQQAYVAIFGPLKSGKSTLMNAICAAYVSEVTCLPAYPCMVYVSHAEEPTFVITHYDGSCQTFHDAAEIERTVQAAHAELNQRLREVEAEGGLFDPAEHLPSAIRRIDVKVPAGDLAESGAVLVDTPGLYTRMRFGYDRMTRDFRDEAACAIFVVKTDNLFLSQVFDEFGELLELFSRIFLVVNLDASKQDLKSDGTLVPSLEHENPERVVEAFEQLAMTAPLKRAADEGRLGIYPVNLLGAAARRIRAGGDPAEAEEGEASPVGEADFSTLLGDLTRFLNSNDYLRAFIRDSLKRAGVLMEELVALGREESVTALRRQLADLVAERDQAETALEAVRRLRKTEWRDALAGLEEMLHAAAAEQAGRLSEEMGHVLENEVHGWFQDEASLAALESERIKPQLQQTRKQLADHVAAELSNRISGPSAGLKTDPSVLQDLETAGISLSGQARDALEAVDPTGVVTIEEPLVRVAEIPVRRGVWDWLLLRSPAKVRRRLFGKTQQPDKPLAPATKEKRLRDEGRENLQAQARRGLEGLLEEARAHFAERYFLEYAQSVETHIASRLERAESEASERLQKLVQRLEAYQTLVDGFERLEEAGRRAGDELVMIQNEFVEGEADLGLESLEDPADHQTYAGHEEGHETPEGLEEALERQEGGEAEAALEGAAAGEDGEEGGVERPGGMEEAPLQSAAGGESAGMRDDEEDAWDLDTNELEEESMEIEEELSPEMPPQER